MKLSPLLAQYLSINKQLSLAGIGRFILEDSTVVTDETGKEEKVLSIGKIRFEQDSSVKEDAELVKFISEQSGKMKSLASADLDSHLEQARQFLNIGKPFSFEGIGTLNKTKSGKFDFTQSKEPAEKNKDSQSEGEDMTSTTEESFTNYEAMFSPKKPKIPVSKRVVTGLIITAGIALAVFGGYLVYNKTKPKDKPVIENNNNLVSKKVETTAIPIDTTSKKDTTTFVPSKPVDSSGTYRFVIEKAARQRALYRYNFLKNNFIDVKMDTKDSVLFKLYFVLPATPKDTTRKRDSLQRLYGTRGKTVVEQN